MAQLDKGSTVTLVELVVSSLATTDALAKILIGKGLITEVEFMKELAAERANYQRLLQKKGTDA